jgi:hypothetical protein
MISADFYLAPFITVIEQRGRSGFSFAAAV